MRDENGKTKYARILEFDSREAGDEFSKSVVAAVLGAFPGAFEGTDAFGLPQHAVTRRSRTMSSRGLPATFAAACRAADREQRKKRRDPHIDRLRAAAGRLPSRSSACGRRSGTAVRGPSGGQHSRCVDVRAA